MELLNLDSLVSVEREVTLGGEDYTVAHQTVGMMLDAIAATKMDPEKEPDAMFVQMVKSAKRILPDAPDEVIEGMNLDQLSALVEFAVASSQEVVDKSEAEEVDEEGK